MNRQSGGAAKGCLIAAGIIGGVFFLIIGATCAFTVWAVRSEVAAFKALTPAQHVMLAKDAEGNHEFTLMMKHLDAVPDGTPGKAEVLEAYKAYSAQLEKGRADKEKADQVMDAKRLKFIQKTWMTGRGRLFHEIHQGGEGYAVAMAEPGWYFAHLEEKRLACGAVWLYFFGQDGSSSDLLVIKDSRTGKDLATFSKGLGLRMED